MEGKAQILIAGHLDHKWQGWFEEMEIYHEGSNTILSGNIKDESYLHGILNRIRDLNLKLISVNTEEEKHNNKQQTINIMKTINFTLFICAMTLNLALGQSSTEADQPSTDNGKKAVEYRHSIGASLFMLLNFSKESADYVLLTYGYQLTEKDRIFAEYNTWKYAEPMGTYENSKEFYPGYVRTHGIGFGYQRFLWKGLFASGQATPFLKQYYNEQDEKTQKGFQLYLQFAVGYRFEFFKKRFFVEPAYALKYWPVDTNVPADFAAVEKGTPKTIFEPSLNFGFKF